MGIIVMACYRPKPKKQSGLRKVVKTHLDILKKEKLVTDRTSIICEAKDGTVIEIFEWKSQQHIDDAHSNPRVQKMWEEFSKVCDYVPIGNLKEASELFSGFAPLN
ncbi:MAG: hypothetical protein AB7K37_09235 [Cyclobacteriaceae bacterium]